MKMVKLSVEEVEKKKQAGLPLSRPENYQLIARRASRHYYDNNGWSSLEIKFKRILKKYGLKELEHYIHNFEIPNGLERGMFKIDFVFPSIKIAIELNPRIWHIHLGKTEQKDARKWTQLERLGFKPLFIDDITDSKLDILAQTLAKELNIRR